MEVNKNKGISVVCALIVLGVFHLIAFLTPTVHTVTFWLGYSFGIFAVLLLLSTLFVLFGKNTKEERFLNISPASIAWIYFILQMILSTTQIFNVIFSHTSALIVDSVLSGLFLIFILAAYAGTSSISESEQETADKVFYLKEIQMDLELLQSTDETLKAKIEELAETVRFSDPMSHSRLAELESEIRAKCTLLKECIHNTALANAACDDIKALLAERSAKCKLLKGVADPVTKTDNSGVKFIAAAVGVFGFIAMIVLIVTFVIVPNSQYKTAEQLFADGRYSAAVDAFESLGSFKDSKSRARECREQINEEQYLTAVQYYEQSLSAEALRIFYEIQDYKDSKKMIERIYNRLAVNGEIYFGSYNGAPVAWKILNTEPDRMLLITQEPVVKLAFHDDLKNITWEDSAIRKWLNQDFLDGFTREQTEDILIDKSGGIEDKVFLLSEEEYTSYSNIDFRTTADWWLRTKTDAGMMYVYGDNSEINATGESVVRAMGVRPCIWINLR